MCGQKGGSDDREKEKAVFLGGSFWSERGDLGSSQTVGKNDRREEKGF